MDQITIERARRGERDALAALLTGLQDIWFRFCVSQLRDADRARDAVQETALRFMRQIGSFRGESRIESWSLGIALNVIREQRRGDRKLDLEKIAAGVSRRDDRASDFDESRPDIDELSQLHAMLDKLPDRQRQAIVLRFFEDHSVEETAAAMQCAAGTVKATVHQALRALRTKLSAIQ